MISNNTIYSSIAAYLEDKQSMGEADLRSKYVPTLKSKTQAELEAQQEIINRAFASADEVIFTFWDEKIYK